MSNTKQQNPPDPVEMLYIESPSISLKQFREAIDRLVTEARIEENNRMQVEKLNLSKLTTDHAEGYNMCATDSNFRIHNRIAELQSQLTNKDTK